MSYTPYYPTGWLNGETGNTPITPEALNHMDEGIENAETVAGEAKTTAANAKTVADRALPKTGGTLTGNLILTEGIHYGEVLPAAGKKGRIFFLKA